MFTPPPSPLPLPVQTCLSVDALPSRSPSPTSSSSQHLLILPPSASPSAPPLRLPPLPSLGAPSPLELQKRAVGRRTKYISLVLVPLLLALATLLTRSYTHPAALDLLSGSHYPHHHPDADSREFWHLHKRHPASGDSSPSEGVAFPTSGSGTHSGSSKGAAASSTATPTSTKGLPPIPTDTPPLPTPFPQPFDSSVGTNFSTQACLNFFTNMTQSDGFRQCRPFSLLLQSSNAFIQQAQSNLTLLNNVLWGTCNTKPTQDACLSNLSWFTVTLQSACAAELDARTPLVTQTLTALLAYPLLRDAACAADASTGAYCYLGAVAAKDPSDLYYYNLPLGLSLPVKATPSCGACTRSLLARYADALPDADKARLRTSAGASGNATTTIVQSGGVQKIGDPLDALSAGVYELAAERAVQVCGQGFALVSNGARGRAAPAAWVVRAVGLGVVLALGLGW